MQISTAWCVCWVSRRCILTYNRPQPHSLPPCYCLSFTAPYLTTHLAFQGRNRASYLATSISLHTHIQFPKKHQHHLAQASEISARPPTHCHHLLRGSMFPVWTMQPAMPPMQLVSLHPLRGVFSSKAFYKNRKMIRSIIRWKVFND